VRLPVARGAYPLERLRVAPQFGAPPDSALAARIDSEAALAREVGRRAHESPRLWRSAFVPPRPSRVTSGFGRGREFNGAVQSRHMGVDFAGKKGAPVRAANRGVVALVADFYLGGRVVYIDHGAGLVTGYFHLSRATVAEGDTVARGEVIGRVGATGRVTGPHLHWVARYGAVTVDPMTLFSLARRPRRAS
jgi:murein DD-endopeptidase MepM/ murein hydrolase activator NlpD